MEIVPGTEPVDEAGEWLRERALGQPQEKGLGCVLMFVSVYSGREVWAWVARHERMWKGESMEISKWRRFLPVGSLASTRDRRRTIYSYQHEQLENLKQKSVPLSNDVPVYS
jgi:hypothetical protein